MVTNIDELVQVLDARRSGNSWMARCPSHDDRNPSLALREVNGRMLVHCHAGCGQEAVIDALRERGLWHNEDSNDRRIVCCYDYTDRRGQLLYQIVRYEPKDFSLRRPDGRGGWIRKMHRKRVLYRLPEVLEAPIVFVVEGERDVETLREYGFVATTNAFGARAPWRREYTEALKGKEIIVIPDNDVRGRKRAYQIASALVGNVEKLSVLELQDGVKDITDWFGKGHSELELISRVEAEGVYR